MTKREKEILRKLYETPKPLKKDDFLMGLPERRISNLEFIKLQIENAKPIYWIINLVLGIFGVGLSERLAPNSVWVLSAFAPLISLSGIYEALRSYFHNMSELEMTTRFSLKSTIAAKLILFGAIDLIMIAVISLAFSYAWGFSLLMTSVYIFVPFLLTDIVCLNIVRRLHSKDALYYCFGGSLLMAASLFIAHSSIKNLYASDAYYLWITAFLFLLIVLVLQITDFINNMEDTVWNCI